MMTRTWHILTATWRGTALFGAVLLGLLLMRAGVWFGLEALGDIGGAPLWIGVGLSVILLIWQSIGVFRASDQQFRDGQSGRGVFGYVAIFIAGVFAAEQGVRLSTGGAEDPIVRTAPPPMQLPVDGTTVTLSGPISFPMYAALETALSSSTIKTAVLTSDGGLIHAARGLARLIQKHELATHVEGPCRSACTLVFIAGSPRTLAPDAVLGFHAYHIDWRDGLGDAIPGDATKDLQHDFEWMHQRGISPEFTARISTISHEDMWHPNRKELIEAGVLFAQ